MCFPLIFTEVVPYPSGFEHPIQSQQEFVFRTFPQNLSASGLTTYSLMVSQKALYYSISSKYTKITPRAYKSHRRNVALDFFQSLHPKMPTRIASTNQTDIKIRNPMLIAISFSSANGAKFSPADVTERETELF